MIIRSGFSGTNFTVLGARFGDPATIAVANDAHARIDAVMEALQQPWWSKAACRGDGVDRFFNGHRQNEALQTCRQCPAMFECRAEAIADPRLDGVRGGMTANARRNRTPEPANETEPQ